MSRQLSLAYRSTPPAPAVVRTVRPANIRIDPCPGSPRPFVGRPVVLDRTRRCAVCGNVMELKPDEPAPMVIAFDKWVAHVGCGRTKP